MKEKTMDYIVEDNTLLNIEDDNIYMEFNTDNKKYVAFADDSNDIKEINMMFAKLNIVGNEKILRNIENPEEYQKVVNEFNRRIQSIV